MRDPIIRLQSILLCCIVASPALASDAPSSDVKAITAIERNMAAAQDAQGVTGTWARNVVWYDLAPPPEIDGKAAAVKETTAQFKPITNLRTKILRMSVGASGKLGYAFSTQEFIADLKQGGSGLDFIFRETDIFRKESGKWRLIHQHLSVPVNMATGKAIITNKDWLVPADRK